MTKFSIINLIIFIITLLLSNNLIAGETILPKPQPKIEELPKKETILPKTQPKTDVFENINGDLKIVNIDITQPFGLRDIGSNVDKVIHLAGIVGEGACSKDVRYSYELNVTGVSNLINCFHGSLLNKFIYLSSVSVYDKSNESPISEYDKTSNIGIYNSTKLAAELLVSAYCTKYDISYCIGRATSAYGPYQLKYSVLSYIILELLKHNKLTLFNPYDIKDYIYVTDLVEGIITLLNTKESGLFNISSGQGIQLTKIVKIIADKYVSIEQGSGALKVTPAHDFNDFEIGKRHKLEFVSIFEKNGKMNNNVPKEFIPSIEKGFKAAMKNGPLAGFEMDSMKITLKDGSFHAVDSSEVAFKIAGSMAFQAAAKKAGPILLEPVMRVEVVVPEEYLGDPMGDMKGRRGRIHSMEARGGTQILTAFDCARARGEAT